MYIGHLTNVFVFVVVVLVLLCKTDGALQRDHLPDPVAEVEP